MRLAAQLRRQIQRAPRHRVVPSRRSPPSPRNTGSPAPRPGKPCGAGIGGPGLPRARPRLLRHQPQLTTVPMPWAHRARAYRQTDAVSSGQCCAYKPLPLAPSGFIGACGAGPVLLPRALVTAVTWCALLAPSPVICAVRYRGGLACTFHGHLCGDSTHLTSGVTRCLEGGRLDTQRMSAHSYVAHPLAQTGRGDMVSSQTNQERGYDRDNARDRVQSSHYR